MNDSFLKLCENINTNNFIDYLLKGSWKEIFLKRKINYKIFQSTKDNNLYQINIPIKRDYPDYAEMIYRSCETLADFENIDLNLAINKILYPFSDTLKFRTNNKRVLNGSLPVEDAVSFFETSKKLIADAAMDVLAKTKHRTSKYTNEVSEFVSRCRFGQTEIGSYVLSVICPYSEEEIKLSDSESLFGNDYKIDNLTTKIVKKVINSTNKISEAVEQNTDLNEFINRNDDDFISLNFIEDLSDFIEDDNDSYIEIKTELGTATSENTSTVFHSRKNKILREFVDNFKRKENVENKQITVSGKISRAAANPDLEHRNTGEITIEKDNKKIVITLKYVDYVRAVNAHQNGWNILVKGIENDGKIECEELTVFEETSIF